MLSAVLAASILMGPIVSGCVHLFQPPTMYTSFALARLVLLGL